MPSIIKVDQIQSDLGTVNVSSNLQFSSGFTMLSPTLTTPTLSSPTLTTPTTSGVMTLGAGIRFPATQVTSSNANTLDDYEEGTFTPSYTGGSSNPTVTYDWRGGMYVKIGRMVYFWLAMGVNSTTGGSGDLLVSGLPFAAQSGDETQVGIAGCGSVHVTYGGWAGGGLSYNVPLTYLVDAGASYIRLYRTDSSSTRLEMTGLAVTALTAGDRLFTSGVYLTST